MNGIEITGGLIGLVAVAGSLTFLTLVVVMGVWSHVARTREREHTTREIAAYVAEGTIDAPDAERLLIASRKPQQALAKWHKEHTRWTPPSA